LVAAIAFDETLIRELFAENNLEITKPIQYGSWSQRKDYLSSQDIVIAVKK
jgi:hypothetical protein